MAAIPFNLTESILSRTFFALAGSAFVFVPIAGLQFLLLFLPYAENQKLKRNRISPKGFLLDALGCFVTLTVLRWIFV
ncbi:MAG: hypothetical protein ACRD6X_07205 [Pyrinomonadaceae bacterium]